MGWFGGTPIFVYPLVNYRNYGKSPYLLGKFSMSMAIFNSKLLVYQRVYTASLGKLPKKMGHWRVFHQDLPEEVPTVGSVGHPESCTELGPEVSGCQTGAGGRISPNQKGIQPIVDQPNMVISWDIDAKWGGDRGDTWFFGGGLFWPSSSTNAACRKIHV